jgi:hypothetical protein
MRSTNVDFNELPDSNEDAHENPFLGGGSKPHEKQPHSSSEQMRARNRDTINRIPEAMSLLLPAKNEITLVHITDTNPAKEIIETGFTIDYTVFGASDLVYTTNPLYRPGHEVSADWPEEWSNRSKKRIIRTESTI